MTRDEALAKMPKEIRCNGGISDAQFIDRLVALGMLKLMSRRAKMRVSLKRSKRHSDSTPTKTK